MKILAAFTACLFLAACGQLTSNKTVATDTTAPSVSIIPDDPGRHNMPVKEMDTSQGTMPIVKPDSNTIKPL
jgi:hypothetical protein